MKRFSDIAKKSKVPWVRLWIDDTWEFSSNFVNPETGEVNYEELGREEYEFRMALKLGDFSKNERAKYLWEEAVENKRIKSENGKKGGRPRKNNGDADTSDGSDESTTVSKNIGNDTEARQSVRTGEDSVRRVGVASPAVCHKSAGAPVRNSGRRFRNKEEYMQWAIDSGLDATDASECWDATLERGGKDADGNVVKNIKAFAVKWCKTREEKRKTA